uniref:Secreted protein n=2 Tax=Ixodes ricinus TaxID=34613 RepID=A0A147BFP7_IXORI
MMPTMLQERRMLSNVFRLLWLVAAALACNAQVSWACRHCGTLRSLGPPPASIADMPPPPLPPLNPLLALVVRGDVNRTWDGSLCERVLRGAAPRGASPLGPSEWWLHPSTVVDGDRAWPLAVVMVAGSATILGLVLLLVLSRNKRWQPVRSPPGHPGLPSALLPTKGILVGAEVPTTGSYDNSGFAEGGHGASLLRQLQPPPLAGYRPLAHA